MKKMKSQDKQAKTLTPLPKETRRYWGQSPLGEVYSRIWNGKFSAKSTVAFSLALPEIDLPDFEETRNFLEKLRDEIVIFLSHKSQSEEDGVTFGGLSFQWEAHEILLSFCYGPFSQRIPHPIARLTLSNSGSLLKMISPKQKSPRAKHPRGTKSTTLSHPSS